MECLLGWRGSAIDHFIALLMISSSPRPLLVWFDDAVIFYVRCILLSHIWRLSHSVHIMVPIEYIFDIL
jgi:hypothetical protein